MEVMTLVSEMKLANEEVIAVVKPETSAVVVLIAATCEVPTLDAGDDLLERGA